jgi:multimeric flavodoxin WrbA
MALKAIILNCTLKKSPTISNTDALIQKVVGHLQQKEVETEVIRVVDYQIPFGVSSDEGAGDEWPAIYEKIKQSNILIIASPIWFGVRASVTQMIIERLDGSYSDADSETGRYPLYGKVAGVIITGNEDGAHNVAAHTLYNLTHLGCTVPPNADCYWVGEAGPGPSYIEAGGDKHLYTNRTARYLVENVTQMARLLEAHPLTTNLKELDKLAKAESDD